jgi:hypothetical protein
MQTFTNNAYGFLASGVSAVATTLVLGSGEGARFPTTSGDNFKVTLIALTNGQETAWEIVNVTGRSSDTLTVTRAQEGTPALVWPSLTRVELRLTAGATESKANLGTAAYKNIPASGNASATEVVYGSDTRLHVAATVVDTASINLTLTGQQISADAIFGTTASTVAAGNHAHAGVYEPVDASILRGGAIGFSVQAYDSDLAAIAGLGTTGFIERTGTGTASTATVTAAGKALLDDADAATQRTTLGLGGAAVLEVGTTVGTVAAGNLVKEKLTANRTYYVRTDGSNSNTGLVNNAGGAFLTLQKAYDTLVTLDLGGFIGTIQVGQTGQTFTDGLLLMVPVTGGNVTLDLGGSTIHLTNGYPINVYTPIALTVQNGTLRTTTGGDCLRLNVPGTRAVVGANMVFGACAGSHLVAINNSLITLETSYSITGSATASHLRAALGGSISISGITVTLSGTLSFAPFARVLKGGLINSLASSFTGGTITGSRYICESLGVIDTYGGGANYFPGNAAGTGGTTTGGGVYA